MYKYTAKIPDNSPDSPFNWAEFLDDCIRIDLHESDIRNMDRVRRLAESWVTCACGNLCDKIPRLKSGCPVDDELNGLGMDFAGNIGGGYWHGARRVLEKIEVRSKVILEEIEKAEAGDNQ